jgi:RHS repeat-associated protein
MIGMTDLQQQITNPELSGVLSLRAETSFDGLREDKVPAARRRTTANAEDRAVPRATKQGAKSARPSSHRRNYDPAGRLDYVTNFNGSITDYNYDNANRLTSMENRKSDSTILATYAFTLDGNGNRTNTVQTEQYTNLPAYSAASYTYNFQKNRLLSAGANSFTYDNEGQLATGYGSSYTFDYEHRLIAIGTDQFTYDGTGNRLQATRNGVVTRYIYDAFGNLLAEADGSNNITRYYIQGAGLLAAVTSSNTLYCYHFNATGHTMAMTDSAQVVVNKFSYDPYGNITNQSEGINQPFKYVGQFGVITEPNGFYYMRARYYDPQVGRFISEDPIGFDGGDENLYAYVKNNPVMGVDPWGLAYLQHRPLDVTGLRNTTFGPFYHSAFRYDDGKISGYNPDPDHPGVARVGGDIRVKQSVTDQYHNVGAYLDDDILRQAEANIKPQWDQHMNSSNPNYSLFFHNCHDYTAAVMNEYNNIVSRINSNSSQTQSYTGK